MHYPSNNEPLDPVFDPTHLYHSRGDVDDDDSSSSSSSEESDENDVDIIEEEGSSKTALSVTGHLSSASDGSTSLSAAEVEVDPVLFRRPLPGNKGEDEDDDDDDQEYFYTKEDLQRYQQKREKRRSSKRSVSKRHKSPSSSSTTKQHNNRQKRSDHHRTQLSSSSFSSATSATEDAVDAKRSSHSSKSNKEKEKNTTATPTRQRQKPTRSASSSKLLRNKHTSSSSQSRASSSRNLMRSSTTTSSSKQKSSSKSRSKSRQKRLDSERDSSRELDDLLFLPTNKRDSGEAGDDTTDSRKGGRSSSKRRKSKTKVTLEEESPSSSSFLKRGAKSLSSHSRKGGLVLLPEPKSPASTSSHKKSSLDLVPTSQSSSSSHSRKDKEKNNDLMAILATSISSSSSHSRTNNHKSSSSQHSRKEKLATPEKSSSSHRKQEKRRSKSSGRTKPSSTTTTESTGESAETLLDLPPNNNNSNHKKAHRSHSSHSSSRRSSKATTTTPTGSLMKMKRTKSSSSRAKYPRHERKTRSLEDDAFGDLVHEIAGSDDERDNDGKANNSSNALVGEASKASSLSLSSHHSIDELLLGGEVGETRQGSKHKHKRRESMKREKSSSRMSSNSNSSVKDNTKRHHESSRSSLKILASDPSLAAILGNNAGPSSLSPLRTESNLRNSTSSNNSHSRESSSSKKQQRSNLKRSDSVRVTLKERFETGGSPSKSSHSKKFSRRASMSRIVDGNNTSGTSRRNSLDMGASSVALMQQRPPLRRRSKSWSVGDTSETEQTRDNKDNFHQKRPPLRRSSSQCITKKEQKDQMLRARDGRRAAFKRYNSQLNLQSKLKEDGNKKKKKGHKSSSSSGHKKTQKTSLLDLISDRKSDPGQPKMERKSSLRFSSLTLGSSDEDSVPAQSTDATSKKTVRFATNDSGERVWCLVKTVPKQPSSGRSVVWWTEQELDERQETDLRIALLVRDTYRPTLSTAFESARKPGAKVETVELSGESLGACSLARGLEHQVLFPEWPDHRKRHTKAVLAAQNLIQCKQDAATASNSMFLFNDSELKLLRLQSLKLSRSSLLLALKMAELDQALVNQPDEDENEHK